MASFASRAKSLLGGLLAGITAGAGRALASFVDRYDRHALFLYEQRAHISAHARQRMERRHLTGERAMSSMMRGSGGLGWPGAWTQDRAKQALYFRRWVYIAADRICSTVAAMPPRLAYVRPGRNERRINKAFYEARYCKSLHAIKPHEEVEPVAADHPLARLLKQPNAWDKSPGQLWYYLVLFLILTGNAYLWVVPDRAFGKPLELWVIPSQFVMGPIFGPAGAKYYRIMPYQGGAGSFTIPADEIIHFSFKNPLNMVDGFSQVQAIAPWVDVSESIDASRYWTFKKGTQASGAIELGPKYDVDDFDIEALAAKFLARQQGEHNAGSTIILPPDAKFVPLHISARDMAFDGGFEQLRDSILAAFGIPKGMVGITDPGSDRALWGERAVFYEIAILPKVRYIAEEITASLCRRWDDELVFYWEDPTPPDPQQINADINVDAQHGAISPNEIRSLRGREPLEDPLADEPWLNPSMVPLSQMRQRFEQEKQQQQQTAAPAQNQSATLPEQAAPPTESMQQQQGKFGDNADAASAQEAAVDINDQLWNDHDGAVQKALDYNQRLETSRSGWRLRFDGKRFAAVDSFAETIRNGLVRKGWQSGKHPRRGKGERGGQFVGKLNGEVFSREPAEGIEAVQASGAGTRVGSGKPLDRFSSKDPARQPEEEPPIEKTRQLEAPRPPSGVSDTYVSWSERSPLYGSLEASPVKHAMNLSSGVNKTYLYQLSDGAQGVFKPQGGEAKKSPRGIPAGTGYKREVAASRVADVLGYGDLVPATTFRVQEEVGIGSIQRYEEDSTIAAGVSGNDKYDGRADAERGAALDYLLGNIDRHQGNWLLKEIINEDHPDVKSLAADFGATKCVTESNNFPRSILNFLAFFDKRADGEAFAQKMKSLGMQDVFVNPFSDSSKVYVSGASDSLRGHKLVLIDNGFSLPTSYHPESLFHMSFWRNAVKHNLQLPDLGSWRGKWNTVEKELRGCGIEDEAIELAKQRFDNLLSLQASEDGERPYFANLPGFFSGKSMSEIVQQYDRRNRGFRAPGEST